jgi:flagellin-specific chaperone FliS
LLEIGGRVMNDCSTCDARMREINRLRAIVREYDWFYKQISEANQKRNWDKIAEILAEVEE